MIEQSCLILFARAPEAGEVKTRLAASLGNQQALSLYRRMLARQIDLVNSVKGVSRQLHVAGDMQHADFNGFAGSLHPQTDGDIGRRMAAALESALTGHRDAVLIGCDSPGLDRAYLERAFSILASGHDAVFGPATDGGYVLVGIRRALPALFTGVDWGTTLVMAQTRKRLQQAALTWEELDLQVDIDEPEDLSNHAELVSKTYGERGKDW